MAEARGRPRPSQPHPDAEVEDPDGVLGGRDRDSDAEFSTEEGLPGDGADQNAYGEEGAAEDPDTKYKERWTVDDDEELLRSVVHRMDDAEKAQQGKVGAAKQELFRAFMHDHEEAYPAAQAPRMPIRCRTELWGTSVADERKALQRQSGEAEKAPQ